MQKKYNNIVIDGHNLFYRSFYTNTVDCLINDETIYTGGIELFLHRLQRLRLDYGYTDTPIYVLLDNPTSTLKIRQLIDEEYKSHRLENKYTKEIYRTISYLKEVLRNYFDNVYVLQINNCEADDLVLPLLKRFNSKDETLLVSADLDWSRSLSHSVHYFNFKKIYDLDLFNDEYGFVPNGRKINLYKAIRGDTSDNISPSVPYMPKDLLIYLIDNYYDVDINKFANSILYDDKIPTKWKNDIKANDRDIRKNYQLVDFIPIDDDIDDYLQVCKRNKALVRVWFKIIGIDIPAWAEDISKPDNFLSIETFKKVRKKRRK